MGWFHSLKWIYLYFKLRILISSLSKKSYTMHVFWRSFYQHAGQGSGKSSDYQMILKLKQNTQRTSNDKGYYSTDNSDHCRVCKVFFDLPSVEGVSSRTVNPIINTALTVCPTLRVHSPTQSCSLVSSFHSQQEVLNKKIAWKTVP